MAYIRNGLVRFVGVLLELWPLRRSRRHAVPELQRQADLLELRCIHLDEEPALPQLQREPFEWAQEPDPPG